jgi:hypothetical protein
MFEEFRMMRWATVFTGFLAFAIGQKAAAQKATLPKTPPPAFALVTDVNKDKNIVKVQFASNELVPEFAEAAVERGGQKVKERVLVHRSQLRLVEAELALKSLRVLDAAGKEVRGEELLKRLTPGTMVLRQTDALPVDPAYRKLLSRDALILMPQADVAELVAGSSHAGKPSGGSRIEQPKTPREAEKLLHKGGEYWSAPEAASVGPTEYSAPGRFLYLWPAEDRVVEAVKFGNTWTARLTFHWMLRAGAELPPQPSGSFVYYLGQVGGAGSEWGMTRDVDTRAKQGSFVIDLPDSSGRWRGAHDLVLVLVTNRVRDNIPVGNFVKIKVRFPE